MLHRTSVNFALEKRFFFFWETFLKLNLLSKFVSFKNTLFKHFSGHTNCVKQKLAPRTPLSNIRPVVICFLYFYITDRHIFARVVIGENFISIPYFEQGSWNLPPRQLLDICLTLNVHKSFRRRSGRLLNVLCMFKLCAVTRGIGYIL